MSEAWDKELLDELEEVFSEAGMNAFIDEISGTNAVVVEYDGFNAVEDCNVSVVHPTDDATAVSVLITVRSELGEKASEDIAALLPYLNKYLTVGSFGITRENGYFWFGSTFVIDEDIDRTRLLRIIAANIDICVGTAEEAIALTALMLNGEQSVTELMNEDTAIIQF